jgi:hypothetical protein
MHKALSLLITTGKKKKKKKGEKLIICVQQKIPLTWLGMVVYICNPNTQKAKSEGSLVLGKPELI